MALCGGSNKDNGHVNLEPIILYHRYYVKALRQ